MCPIEVNSFRKAKCRMPKKRDRSFNSETPESINVHMLCDYLDGIKEALRILHKLKALQNPDQRLPETIFVVVEGSLLFYNKKVCERLHVHLWVDEDCETCLTNSIFKNIWAGANTRPDFANVFLDSVWTPYLLHRDTQLENVPGALRLQGGLAAKQLLESAVQACQSATQPYSNTAIGGLPKCNTGLQQPTQHYIHAPPLDGGLLLA